MKTSGSLRFVFILFYLSGISILLKSQPNNSRLLQFETELAEQFDGILKNELYQREVPSVNFFNNFIKFLKEEGSFNFSFDSLKGRIGSVYSPDKRIRIFTWNVPAGTNEILYYGIIQFYSDQDKDYRIVDLNNLPNPELYPLNNGWDGALYYEIVENKHAGQVYYTLLGMNLNNILSNKKIIEVMSIDKFDQIYFCEKLIQYEGKIQDRIVFEYNEKATMMLHYDKRTDMIIFDHLSPSRPSLEGRYQFYGPDFTYDGLKFEKGIWVYFSNIDITN